MRGASAETNQPFVTLARRVGAAVLMLDHVTKSREGRGRFAFGSQHKLASGDVGFLLEARQPAGIGRTGRTSILISKDRHGALRQKGSPGRDMLSWYADLVLEGSEDGL